MSWKNILSRIGYGWSIKHVFYRFDWTTANAQDVKELLIENKEMARILIRHELIPIKKAKYQDKTVMNVFEWVTKNINYATDNQKFGKKEKWETIDEVLGHWYNCVGDNFVLVASDTYTQPEEFPDSVRIGDCESMAMTCVAICTALGCNPIQISVVAGLVAEGGHAWVEYQADETMEWYILDPAYDPRNTAPFKIRFKADKDTRYLKRWFKVSDFDID